MKSNIKNFSVSISLLFLIFLFNSCKNEDVILVTTNTTVTNITGYSASSGGVVLETTGVIITSRGICWSTSIPSVNDSLTNDGEGYGTFTSELRNLKPNTTYHVRAYANYSGGTIYGKEVIFSTLKLPTLTTIEVTNIGGTKVTCGGIIANNGGLNISESGICWSQNNNPTISDYKLVNTTGKPNFTCDITGLSTGAEYYIRAFATNSEGTAYGNVIKFSTLPGIGTFQDVDGNTYNYVTIGTQTWMAENLKTTKYKDGTAIVLVNDENMYSLYSGAICWYKNDPNTYKNTYGALYNWYAVKTGKLAPAGWHVPTFLEWETLEKYVSNNVGNSVTVAKALAASEIWPLYTTIENAIGNDLTTNNSTGFSALPAGVCGRWGSYNINISTTWWSSDADFYYSDAHCWQLFNYNTNFASVSDEKYNGFSIRCIRD